MRTIIVCFFYLQILLPVILQGQDAPVSAAAFIVSDQETAVVQITASNTAVNEIYNLLGSAILSQNLPAQTKGHNHLEIDMNKPGINLATIIFNTHNTTTEKTVRFFMNH